MKRKHWSDYDSEHTCYGSWRIKNSDTGVTFHGFGIYAFDHNGYIDVWLDEECATDDEKTAYKQYCKARKFSKKDCLQ